MKSIFVLALAAAFFVTPARADVKRVVSLGICQDVILVHVADRDQIAALSHYAREKDRSPIGELAQTIPVTRESAEEVIALEPDLILASVHSDRATRNALQRLGIKTELFTEPKTIAESLEQIRRIARLVDREARGEALISDVENALRRAEPSPGTRPVVALLFQRNGFSTGNGSLVNEMMKHVGFTNLAAEYGFSGWGNIPLELVVANPPEVMLAGAIRPDMPTWADRVLRHPALKEIEGRVTRVAFPERFMDCGGPVLADSAAAMAEARDLALAKRAP